MSTDKLSRLLERMDIPVQRKYTMNRNNLVWLQRHLHERNVENPNYPRAIEEVNYRLENKVYEN